MPDKKRAMLIIGGRQGIGKAVWKLAEDENRDHWGYVVPVSHEEFDVRIGLDMQVLAENMIAGGFLDMDIVYCAGINRLGKLGELDEDDIIDHFNVNVAGFIRVMNAFKRTHGERRVNVTVVVSDSSRIPMRGSIMYASSKAGLAHAIRCAAREMAPTWRVNGVSPGVVADTPMTDYVDSVVPALRGWTMEEALAYERSLIPMGRRVTKEEVADLIISTTKGPEFMTGAIIDITGGK